MGSKAITDKKITGAQSGWCGVRQCFRNVAIFATFRGVRSKAAPKTLPNQGLERKIARKLSSFSWDPSTI
jgi:hypothetical protein